MDSWIERRVGAARGIGRHSAGHEGGAEQILRFEQACQCIGRRELRAVEKRQSFFRTELQRLQAEVGQRALCRDDPAVDVKGSYADHGGAHVRQRREVARSADRPLAGHDRRKPAGEQRLEQSHRRAPYARRALREACELERHHQPRHGHRHRHTGPRSMGEHDVALQLLQVSGLDAHAGELAEPRVHAVDRLPPGEHRGYGACRSADLLERSGVERDRGAAIDVAPRRQRH